MVGVLIFFRLVSLRKKSTEATKAESNHAHSVQISFVQSVKCYPPTKYIAWLDLFNATWSPGCAGSDGDPRGQGRVELISNISCRHRKDSALKWNQGEEAPRPCQ